MIVVCPLHAVETQIEAHDASHVVSLLGPEHMIDTPASIARDRHLQLTLHDIATPMDGYVSPGEAHVRKLIDFLDGWDRAQPMIIHCWAGISRSTASAFTAQCLFNPEASEMELARALRVASPIATPNPMIVAAADGILGREGRMSEAVDAIGRGENAWEGNVFTLEVPAKAEG
jgi:predicted protein tyrosine phosphatase